MFLSFISPKETKQNLNKDQGDKKRDNLYKTKAFYFASLNNISLCLIYKVSTKYNSTFRSQYRLKLQF